MHSHTKINVFQKYKIQLLIQKIVPKLKQKQSIISKKKK